VPISSFYGLQTSLRGLLAHQRALDVAGHNVANASTKGFSRQEAVMAASPAYVIPSGATAQGAGAHLGAGVDVTQYRRVRDEFLDLQYRAQATRLGYEQTRAEQLDRAEVSLAEPSASGIGAQLGPSGTPGPTWRTPRRTWPRARRSPSRATPSGSPSRRSSAS
jgi:flagellar hook-associated protein 1 FlgK